MTHDDETVERAGSTASTRNLIGQRFGRFVPFERTIKSDGRTNRAAWRVRCDCGVERVVYENSLLQGHSQSCGCYFEEVRSRGSKRIHGLGKKGDQHPLYNTWRLMIRRCHSEKDKSYSRYGGRGITVCDRWRFGDGEKCGLECFVSDMGNKPSRNHSIDRINNNGNYGPDNCRWATLKEQCLNTRNSVNSEMVVTLHLQGLIPAQIARQMGKHPTTIHKVLKRVGHV